MARTGYPDWPIRTSGHCVVGPCSTKRLPPSPADICLAFANKSQFRAKERQSRIPCPCLSAQMPLHSLSMPVVDRGVKVMKVCGQLIPSRVPGIALVALARSRLSPAAPSRSRRRRKPETIPPDGLLCQAARHEGRTPGPGFIPTRNPSKSLRPSSQRLRRPRRLRHPCSNRKNAWAHLKHLLENGRPAAGAAPGQFR